MLESQFAVRSVQFAVNSRLKTDHRKLERARLQEFRKLDVWKKAHELVLNVYRVTQSLPKEEVFGITIQLRRAATAIPTRIAEGCGRETNPEFAVDLRRAIAANNELDYLLLLAKDLVYLKPEIYDSLNGETVEVRKMIYGLLRKL